MSLNTLTTLKSAIGAGVRPNLFRVSSAGGFVSAEVTASTATAINTGNFSILCKSAALPGSTVGVIEVPMGAGRRYKIAGDRTFAEWTTTVINDGNFAVRRSLENYQKLFFATNYDEGTVGNRNTTRSTITVKQLGADGTTPIRTYKLINCFISDISAIDLSFDSTDAIEEFTVTWVYDYFEASVDVPSSNTSTTSS
jgi:hypothetical protein